MTFKVRVANFLKSSAFGRGIYPLVQNTYRAYAIPMRRRRLQKHGWDTLKKVHEVLTKTGIGYFYDYGTLLGLIREGGFIKHDDDIDLTILPGTKSPNEVYRVLVNNGFAFLHGFKVGTRIVEFTVTDINGLSIDIFFPRKDNRGKYYGVDIFWEPERTYPSELANTVVETEYSMPEALATFTMPNGVDVSIPKDYEKLLVEEFGSTWRIPDAKFVARENLPCKELSEYAVRITEMELRS